MRNPYDEQNNRDLCNRQSLSKAIEFLSHLDMKIDFGDDDMELALADWMTSTKNHRLFFEEVRQKIDLLNDSSRKTLLLVTMDRLFREWVCLTQTRVNRDSLIIRANIVLCIDYVEKSPSEEKRDEANELFLEATKDLVIGAVEVVETIILTEINPFLGLPAAESAYEHLSDAWREIHESAEAYREAERLRQLEENTRREENG